MKYVAVIYQDNLPYTKLLADNISLGASEEGLKTKTIPLFTEEFVVSPL